MAAADLQQGVGPPLMRAPGVAGLQPPGLGQRTDGVHDHRAALRVEVAVEANHALPGGRHAQAAVLEGSPRIGPGAVGIGQALPVAQRPGECAAG